MHVVATRRSVLQRVLSRAAVTGRHVPVREIDDSLERVPRSVKLLQPFADFLAVVDNSADRPYLVEYCDRESCRPCFNEWEQLAGRLECQEPARAVAQPAWRAVDASDSPEECVIDNADDDAWQQISRNFEAARRVSSAAKSDEWG